MRDLGAYPGHDLDELLDDLETGEEPRIRFHLLHDLLQNPALLLPPPVIVPRYAWQGRVTMLASGEKLGKSTQMGQAVAALSAGGQFLGETMAVSGTLWMALDEPLGDVVRRLGDHGAKDGVVICQERPTFDELEAVIEEHFVRLVVVDTVTEVADGLVENGNAPEQWTPILRQFRQLAQRTECGIVLLHHSNRTTGKYRGSGQLGAGVDVILEMTEHESDPTVRKVRARGRVPVSDFTVRYTAGRYELESGEMTLQMRAYRAVESHPGIGTTKLREVVGGKAKEVDAAVRDLLKTYAIEDRGTAQAHAYHVRPVLAGTGPGQAWDRQADDSLSDVGQGGTGLGQGTGQAYPVPPYIHRAGTGYEEAPSCTLCNTPVRRTVHKVWRCPTCCPDNRWAA